MSKKLLIALSAVLLFVAAACQKAEEQTGDNGFSTPVLSASVPEVNIISIREGEALNISWGKSDERGVVYKLSYGIDGASEDAFKTLNCYANHVVSYSYKDLDKIRADFGVAPGTEFKLAFKVEAKSIFADAPKYSEPLIVNVMYNVKPLELYGIGTAFEWGTDREVAAEKGKMTTTDHVRFTWEGWLESGKDKTFKFLTHESIDNESGLPCYTKYPDKWYDDKLTFRVSESEKEELFTVNKKSGIYRLTVDVKEMKIKMKYLGDGKPHLYGYGENFPNEREEFQTTDEKIWTWTGNLRKGEFFFLTSETDWDTGYSWNEEIDGKAPKGPETVWTMVASDNVWESPCFTISRDGNYTLIANLETLKLTIKCNDPWEEPHLYGFGGAFGGWEVEDKNEFTTEDGETWSWTGALEKDSFVLMTSKTDESGYVWNKSADGKAPTGQVTEWTAKAATNAMEGLFNESCFSIKRAGNYTVTFNSETLKLTITCNDPQEDRFFYAFGDAFGCNWVPSNAVEFTTTDQKVWTWTGNLVKEGFVILTSKSGEAGYVWDKSVDGDTEPTGVQTVWTMLEKDNAFGGPEFQIAKNGNYTITLEPDENKMTIKCNNRQFFIAGDALDWGWDREKAAELDTEDQETWTWTGDVKGYGGFQIFFSRTDENKKYTWDMAADNNAVPGENAEHESVWTMFLKDESVTEGHDDPFMFMKEGNYTVTLVPGTLKMTVKYNGERSDNVPDTDYDMDGMYLHNVYAGYTPDYTRVMTTTDNDTYVYKGNFDQNEGLVIALKKNNNTSSTPMYPLFAPTQADQSKMEYRKEYGAAMSMWFIREDGYYSITAKISDLSFSIERLGDKKEEATTPEE